VAGRSIELAKNTTAWKLEEERALVFFRARAYSEPWWEPVFASRQYPLRHRRKPPEQIAAMQAQITARQAQKNDDLAISQRDALQAQLEDAMLAANRRDSPQNPPKTGEAGANPSQRDVVSAADQSQPQQETQSATSEALPAPVRAKPQAENEQATASQNRAHRSSRTFRRPYTRGETSFLEPADLA